MLLSLDTSLTSTGYALFNDLDQRLVTCGSIGTSPKYTLAQRMQHADAILFTVLDRPQCYIEEIVAEVPQLYTYGKSKGDPNRLAPIWAMAGYLIGNIAPTTFRLIRPAEWKGNLKKIQMFAKIIRHMEPEEIAVFNVEAFKKPRAEDCVEPPKEKSIPGDALDAIGLGLYTLGRL